MGLELIHDRGRGPELLDTRITVYNLVYDFLNADKTEQQIADLYSITTAQVAAMRGYFFQNYDAVMAKHREFEERAERGNPPEILALAEGAHARLLLFKEWMESREQWVTDQIQEGSVNAISAFKEWLTNRDTEKAQPDSATIKLVSYR